MIFVAISSLKDCHYCEAAHHAFCLNIGVSQTQIEKLIANYSIDEEDSAKEKAAIDFAVRLAKNSHASSEDDFRY
jgi:AhpD family alkylhydroperoxidase